MTQSIQLKNVQWIKLTNPTKEELDRIGAEYDISSPVLQELTKPTIRAKVDHYEKYVYMVMHVPVFDVKDRKTYSYEIDFVLLKNVILTATFHRIAPLEEFWKLVQKKEENPNLDTKAGHFLYHLIHHLLVFCLRQLDHIQENINTLEDIMFYGAHDEITRDIYLARRDVIDFRRTLKPCFSILESIEERGPLFYGDEWRPHFESLKNEFSRLWDVLEGHKETIQDLYETNESIISSKINKTMKVFTVLAFITFIPNLVTNIFGMSLPNLPLVENPNAFWIISALTVAITLALYFYFKIKKVL